MKKLLESRVELIKNASIKEFVKDVLSSLSEDFWKIPCLGSGKYHPPENQGQEGLIRHLIKCVYIAEDLCRYFGLGDVDRDIVLAGTILHDIKKYGERKDRTDPRHGEIGAEFLDGFELEKNIKKKIKDCVKYHMYRFVGNKGNLERAKNPTKNEFIVQMADFFSSRKYASWLPGKEINEKEIKEFLKTGRT